MTPYESPLDVPMDPAELEEAMEIVPKTVDMLKKSLREPDTQSAPVVV